MQDAIKATNSATQFNKKKGPLSPHLSIYRLQISSAMSICHRIASFICLFGVIAMIIWFTYVVYTPYQSQVWLWNFFATIWGKSLLMLWTYPFAYYLATEIRYLMWSFGYGYTIRQIDISGYLALGGSLIVWLSFWSLILL